ncbi:MAG: DUF882 domain-containing protein [Rhodospirillaceae bacterium]|nr:DUF882 domain-containing protein [Rhodospirillaceae bacterium]
MDWDMAGPRQTSRRGLLIGAGAAGAALVASGSSWAASPRNGRSVRWLAFEHAWTGEKLKITYYENGRYIDDALSTMDKLMRDHVNNTIVEMDPRLYDILFDLNRLMDSSHPYILISGYRSPSTNAKLAARSRAVAKNSYHLRGWAADVRLPGRDLRSLALGAISLKRGGVGMYSRKSNFIHVDSGPIRHWNI